MILRANQNLSAAELAAVHGATSPSGGNPFSTDAEVATHEADTSTHGVTTVMGLENRHAHVVAGYTPLTTITRAGGGYAGGTNWRLPIPAVSELNPARYNYQLRVHGQKSVAGTGNARLYYSNQGGAWTALVSSETSAIGTTQDVYSSGTISFAGVPATPLLWSVDLASSDGNTLTVFAAALVAVPI